MLRNLAHLLQVNIVWIGFEESVFHYPLQENSHQADLWADQSGYLYLVCQPHSD